MLQHKVNQYIKDLYNKGISPVEIGKIFKGSLPTMFAYESPDVVKRYAQLFITKLLIDKQEQEHRMVNYKNLDYGLFLE